MDAHWGQTGEGVEECVCVCVWGGGGGLATKPHTNLLSDTRFVSSGNGH